MHYINYSNLNCLVCQDWAAEGKPETRKQTGNETDATAHQVKIMILNREKCSL